MRAKIIEAIGKAIYIKRNGLGCTPWGIRGPSHKEPYVTDAGAAIAALEATIPGLSDLIDGKAIVVPVEATEEMVAATADEYGFAADYAGDNFAAMIEASPYRSEKP